LEVLKASGCALVLPIASILNLGKRGNSISGNRLRVGGPFGKNGISLPRNLIYGKNGRVLGDAMAKGRRYNCLR